MIRRFDPLSDKPRPLKVTLNCWEYTITVLGRFKLIGNIAEYSHIGISANKTPRQYAYFREIKTEVERRSSDGENIELEFVRGVPTVNTLN